MSLDELTGDVESAYAGLDDELSIALDTQTKNELAVLTAALGPESTDDLVRRAVHLLFQSTTDTGQLDMHLRQGYGVTYDEYLSGMTYEEMSGGTVPAEQSDGKERRYQF
ncbi:hypothetical protein [Halalkalicoccus jeotgali]|uniref:Uncharacterized protein n=1 Tax=Halalkalicoccus jeotgali (strain DSM 18796 / CECT 7217 / JCM 14584 / KCTC 4019 / B3) TaxID=795797 RepID=D8J384_HALJB|nr:hypothetical protein [Halalkalicoccus jeotgali]ADJ15191.1 hypothetical protein HacjB3_09040 [Halalkalicoccus jeotgali B3]ELY35232.1 hypothetical protein C497_13638 [Halalkalicoccus jeotgali B3]